MKRREELRIQIHDVFDGKHQIFGAEMGFEKAVEMRSANIAQSGRIVVAYRLGTLGSADALLCGLPS